MTDTTLDITALLTLDPAKPDEAARLRRGIAELAGWTEIIFINGGKWISPWGEWFPVLPAFETSVDAALTLLDGLFWNLYCAPEFPKVDNPYRCELSRSALGFHSKMELYEDGSTPALAICRAWLRYMLQKAEAR